MLKYVKTALLLGGLLLVASPTFGQDVTRTLNISRQTKVGNQLLSAGKYTLKFDDAKAGEASVTKDGREVVRVRYSLVDLTKPSNDNVIVYGAAPDGSLAVRRVEFKGSKSAVKFE